jgi:xanthine dehydrogenase molybdopterin-binding subunit B
MTTCRQDAFVLQKGALVNIYGDGTVVVNQGGIEMGQGLHLKVAQAACYGLGRLLGKALDIKLIKLPWTDSHVIPNAAATAASTGSEGACEAVIRACAILVERLKPIVAICKKAKADAKKSEGKESKAEEENVTWQEVITKAKADSVDLSAQAQYAGRRSGEDSIIYPNFGVAATEVEIDVLTGEVELLRTDILYDCGQSLNPATDIAQAEGGFIMGASGYLREKIVLSESKEDYGRPISATTWKFKTAGVKDVPKILNVELFENKDFKKGIMSSKSAGEAPLILATSALMAVRYAVSSARRDAGLSSVFQLDSPATPEEISTLCGASADQLAVSE